MGNQEDLLCSLLEAGQPPPPPAADADAARRKWRHYAVRDGIRGFFAAYGLVLGVFVLVELLPCRNAQEVAGLVFVLFVVLLGASLGLVFTWDWDQDQTPN